MVYSKFLKYHSSKISRFHAWKAGKFWLYGATALAALSLGVINPAGLFNTGHRIFMAQADVISNSPTVIVKMPVNVTNFGQTAYLWIWEGAGSGHYVTMSVQNSYWVATLNPSSVSSLGFLAEIGTTSNTTTWDGGLTQLKGQISPGGLTNNGVVVMDGKGSFAITYAPTLSAPVLTAGTVGTPYTLSDPAVSSNPSNVTLTFPTYNVTGPNGFTSNSVTFTPTTAGSYTVTYSENFTDSAVATQTVTVTTTLTVNPALSNTITTTNPGPDINELTAMDLSANGTVMSAYVTDKTPSGAAVIPTIQSVTFTPTAGGAAQTILPDSVTGLYTFPTAGTYTVTYSDGTGATGTVTGSVKTLGATLTPIPWAPTTGTIGSVFDTSALMTLNDPNNSAATIANTTITVQNTTDTTSSFSAATTLPAGTTTFTPDTAGSYTITYSYVDGTNAIITKSATITVSASPTIGLDSTFKNAISVAADATGAYIYHPDQQGVYYQDPGGSTPSYQFPAGNVTIVNQTTGASVPQNPDGTFSLAPSASYTVEWLYPNAIPGFINQTVTVTPNGTQSPTISVPPSENASVGQAITLTGTDSSNTAYVTLTDSKGQPVSTSTAFSNGSLTYQIFDPNGALIYTGSNPTFTPTMNGSYIIQYTYTDSSGLTTLDATTLGVGPFNTTFNSQPSITAPDLSGQVVVSGSNSATNTVTLTTPTVNDPDSATDSHGPLKLPTNLTDSKGNTINPDTAGGLTYSNLPAGTYTGKSTYNYWGINPHDSSNYDQLLTATGTQTVYISSLTLSAYTQSGTVGSAAISLPAVTDATASDLSTQSVTTKLLSAPSGSSAAISNGTLVPDKSGSYVVQYSYTDPQSKLLVTATDTIHVTEPILNGAGNDSQQRVTASTGTYSLTPLTQTASNGNTETATVYGPGGPYTGGGTFNVTPGVYTVTYTDPLAPNATPVSYTVTVNPPLTVNKAPDSQVTADSSNTYHFTVPAEKTSDGSSELYTLSGAGATLNGDGSYTLAPGTYTVTYADPTDSTNTATTTITVNAYQPGQVITVNKLPDLQAQVDWKTGTYAYPEPSLTASTGTLEIIQITAANSSSPETPINGVFNLAPGSYTVTYSDPAETKATETSTITVNSAIGINKAHDSQVTVDATTGSYTLTPVPEVTSAGTAEPVVVTISSLNTTGGASVTKNADGTYSLTPGIYTITYTDPDDPTHIATTTITVNVVQAPPDEVATITVSYLDGSTSLAPANPVIILGKVGQTVTVPQAPVISGKIATMIIYNGVEVSAGSQIVLTQNAQLTYLYTAAAKPPASVPPTIPAKPAKPGNPAKPARPASPPTDSNSNSDSDSDSGSGSGSGSGSNSNFGSNSNSNSGSTNHVLPETGDSTNNLLNLAGLISFGSAAVLLYEGSRRKKELMLMCLAAKYLKK